METEGSNNTNSLASYKDYAEYKLSKDLHRYGPPFLLAMGTLGNIMCIIIMQRKSLRFTTVTTYFQALAFVDLLVLYIGLMRYWLREIIDLDIRKLSAASCKLHFFSLYTMTHYSTWILVAVSVERFISVCFPFKARIICTVTKARITLVSLLVVISAINAHFFWTRGGRIVVSGNETYYSTCGVTSPIYYDFDNYIWPWMDFSLLSFVPFSIMIICNVGIIWEIHKTRRRRVADLNVMSAADNRDTSRTAMLLLTNTSFLLLTMPIVVFVIADREWRQNNNTEHQEAILYLAYACVNLISYLNNAINFLLYCISGRSFRRELKSMLWPARRVHPLQNAQTQNENN